MKRQPLGILLFPLKKSMKVVVLFDRKQRRRNKFELKKTFRKFRGKSSCSWCKQSNSKTHWIDYIEVGKLRRFTLDSQQSQKLFCTFIIGTKISEKYHLYCTTFAVVHCLQLQLPLFIWVSFLFFLLPSHQPKWMGKGVVCYLWLAGGVLIYFHSSHKLTHWQPELFCSHDKCPINRRSKPVKCANSRSTQGQRDRERERKGS